MNKPQIKNTINIDKIKSICQEFIDTYDSKQYIEGKNYHSDIHSDYVHIIFEKTLEAVFGNDIHNYINKQTKELNRLRKVKQI